MLSCLTVLCNMLLYSACLLASPFSLFSPPEDADYISGFHLGESCCLLLFPFFPPFFSSALVVLPFRRHIVGDDVLDFCVSSPSTPPRPLGPFPSLICPYFLCHATRRDSYLFFIMFLKYSSKFQSVSGTTDSTWTPM